MPIPGQLLPFWFYLIKIIMFLCVRSVNFFIQHLRLFHCGYGWLSHGACYGVIWLGQSRARFFHWHHVKSEGMMPLKKETSPQKKKILIMALVKDGGSSFNKGKWAKSRKPYSRIRQGRCYVMWGRIPHTAWQRQSKAHYRPSNPSWWSITEIFLHT